MLRTVYYEGQSIIPSPRLMVPSVSLLVTVGNIKYFIGCYYLQGDICILPMHVAYEWREILM